MVGILRQSAIQVTHRVLSLQPLPAFEDNYIWTLSDGDGRGLVVDPGDADPVLAAIQTGLRPVAILLTHHHADHIGGAAALLERLDIPCYGPVDDRISSATHRVGEGGRVEVPELGLRFDVIEIPGHTRTHIAFHGGDLLFCGDTMFSMGCGRLFEGTPAQMLASLDRLAALPGTSRVCCGHEYTLANGRFAVAAEPDNPDRDRRLEQAAAARQRGEPSLPSTLDSERACNPFLRVDVPAVRAGLEQRAGRTLDRVSAFAELRGWKDGFRA
jgi:hydroxyacylglutathione hydrolase